MYTRASDMFVHFYQNTRRHINEDRLLGHSRLYLSRHSDFTISFLLGDFHKIAKNGY